MRCAHHPAAATEDGPFEIRLAALQPRHTQPENDLCGHTRSDDNLRNAMAGLQGLEDACIPIPLPLLTAWGTLRGRLRNHTRVLQSGLDTRRVERPVPSGAHPLATQLFGPTQDRRLREAQDAHDLRRRQPLAAQLNSSQLISIDRNFGG